jgi:hypothetical protein
MILCQKCLHDNPLGTTFCHSCGTRLVVNLSDVERSVLAARRDEKDERLLRSGFSAIALSSFLLIVALILRFCLVPDMPAIELPSPVIGRVFPETPPGWSTRAPATQALSVTAGAISSPRLAWRHAQAAAVLAGAGIDLARMALWQTTVLSAQEADGSVKTADTLAATALTAAALQAAPLSTACENGAARARTYLQAHLEHLAHQPPLTRTLVALALMDAEELSETQRAAGSAALVDGAAPLWQCYLLPLYPAAQRPLQYPTLTTAWSTGVAADFFALLAGRPLVDEISRYARSAMPNGGEERLLWVFTAWNNPVSPKQIIDALHALSAMEPAPVSSELNQACGAGAATAVALLTLSAPMHVPPLWLSKLP